MIMHLSIIQVLLLIFFIGAILKVAGWYLVKEIGTGMMMFWTIFWLAAGMITAFPGVTSYFAGLVGIGRGADLIIYVSLVVLFFAVFRLLVKVERLSREITLLTRREALKEGDGQKK